ncbi:helix-turn-helix domain-containing protein [Thauera humireducens]
MREVGGNVSAAARRLGISRNTLYRKLGKIG